MDKRNVIKFITNNLPLNALSTGYKEIDINLNSRNNIVQIIPKYVEHVTQLHHWFFSLTSLHSNQFILLSCAQIMEKFSDTICQTVERYFKKDIFCNYGWYKTVTSCRNLFKKVEILAVP
jgi:hypothetical protein